MAVTLDREPDEELLAQLILALENLGILVEERSLEGLNATVGEEHGTDVLTPQQHAHCMSRIRGRDTRPEMLIRRGLFARG